MLKRARYALKFEGGFHRRGVAVVLKGKFRTATARVGAHGGTITATIISTTGAATGRLGGRTVRGCRGCGGLVLGVCTPGEVKERQRLESGRRLL